MNRKEKEMFVADMNERLKKAQATFLVDYQGLNVEAMNRLRKALKETGAEFRVVNNRLLRLASQDTETAALNEHLLGSLALAITYDDVVAPAKVLVDGAKDYDKLEIKVGQVSGRPIDPEAIKRLAGLPGRDELLAQVLAGMQAVPASLVRVLNAVLSSLLYLLKAVEAQKQESK